MSTFIYLKNEINEKNDGKGFEPQFIGLTRIDR
jgi:hypothetical protein